MNTEEKSPDDVIDDNPSNDNQDESQESAESSHESEESNNENSNKKSKGKYYRYENFKRPTRVVLKDGSCANLPYLIGETQKIINLGKIYNHPGYVTEKYYYNPGFISEKLFFSTRDAEEKVIYRSMIFKNGPKPLFVVYDTEYKQVYQADTPSGAWIFPIREICKVRSKAGYAKAETVSGPVFFGFANPKVQLLMRRTPINTANAAMIVSTRRKRNNARVVHQAAVKKVKEKERFSTRHRNTSSHTAPPPQEHPHQPVVKLDIYWPRYIRTVPTRETIKIKWPKNSQECIECISDSLKVDCNGASNTELMSYLAQQISD